MGTGGVDGKSRGKPWIGKESWMRRVVDWGASMEESRLGRVVDEKSRGLGRVADGKPSWIGGRGLGKVAAGKPLLLEKLRTSCYNVGRFCAK